MKLIIGGAFQGKIAYAQKYLGLNEGVIDGDTCKYEELFTCRGINHFHQYIRRMLIDGEDVNNLARLLIEKNPNCIVITNELGYGVVPADAFERLFREQSGRICTELARHATSVCRVVCGIGQVIKDA